MIQIYYEINYLDNYFLLNNIFLTFCYLIIVIDIFIILRHKKVKEIIYNTLCHINTISLIFFTIKIVS